MLCGASLVDVVVLGAGEEVTVAVLRVLGKVEVSVVMPLASAALAEEPWAARRLDADANDAEAADLTADTCVEAADSAVATAPDALEATPEATDAAVETALEAAATALDASDLALPTAEESLGPGATTTGVAVAMVDRRLDALESIEEATAVADDPT